MELLLDCSIRAALMATMVAVVLGALRITNATARHKAWKSILGAMLLLPLISAGAPKAVVRILPAIPQPPIVEPWTPIPSQDGGQVKASVGMAQVPPVEPSSRPAPWRADLLVVAYLFGVGLLLIRLVLGTLRADRLVKRASPEHGFLSSSECACPVTVGWWRPKIVLPSSWNSWPRPELEAVMAHEQEHARRRDPLVQWVGALNRCIFWFHPLAWWLEHRLTTLAEEACDSAAVASGHDPRDYSGYLLNQARAIERAGGRLGLHGAAIGGSALSKRIRRVLDQRPTPALGRGKTVLGTVLCAFVIVVFTACELGHNQRPAPGQPSMNELMHRRAEKSREYQEKQKALMERVHKLVPEEAQQLVTQLKKSPQDKDTYWTLVRYYEYKGDLKGLDALRLWYIEYQPGGEIWPGNINPRFDRASYDRGKALWLANVKRPGATPEMYQRAADYLEGGDKPLAEEVLIAGQKAYPNDARWASTFGRHYAQVLLGSAEPVTEFNVFRVTSAKEAQSRYGQDVRTHLAKSNDARVLAMTAQYLLVWEQARPEFWNVDADADFNQLSRAYIQRALSIDPTSEVAVNVQFLLAGREFSRRGRQLAKMSPADLAAANPSDRMLLATFRMRQTMVPEEAEPWAKELLDLASHNQNDALYGDAVFDANIVLGKVALHRHDKKGAVHFLLAAAQTPGSERIRLSAFDMNLPRALVDYGERNAVAEFLDRMAPRTARSKQFQDWASEIRKGINPDLIPTSSYPGCLQDPC